jgi:hypothetical protein
VPPLKQAVMREEGSIMQPGRGPRPSQILHELLASHPQAASLQAEAANRRALVMCSGIKAGRELAADQAAGLGYERLQRQLDPRHRRPVHMGQGLLLLGVLAAGLTVLDAIELGPLLPGVRSVLPTLAVTAVWLTLSWLAALADREKHWTSVASAIGGAVVLMLLLAAVHGVNLRRGWPTAWGRTYGSTVSGILFGVLLLVLGAGAAVLIARIEPTSCSVARHRWHRARASHEAAVEEELADVQAASVATAVWLGLVRSYASGAAGRDQNVVEATVALASALLENGRPGLPPPLPIL